jgi:hypothetical protein
VFLRARTNGGSRGGAHGLPVFFERIPSVLDISLNVITSSAILFIISAGLLIVFGVMKVINFAHGAFLTATPG